MKNNIIMRTCKIAVTILLYAVIVLGSCGRYSEISPKKASNIAIRTLQKRYGGEFEVLKTGTSAEDSQLSASQKDYDIEVFSKALGCSVHVQMTAKGTNIHDDYEQQKYQTAVNEDIERIEAGSMQQGWTLNKCLPQYTNFRDLQPSESFEEFRENRDKLRLYISIEVMDPGSEQTEDSLFNYFSELSSRGYHYMADLKYYNPYTEMNSYQSLRLFLKNDAITKERVQGMLTRLKNPDGY